MNTKKALSHSDDQPSGNLLKPPLGFLKTTKLKNIIWNQLKHFVESRLDICMENLGFKGIFKPSYNPIAKWFYKDLESSTLHDFFSSTGNDYNRNWIEGKFEW